MKKIFIVMMIAGILTGCSDSSTKSITVCKGSFDYGDILITICRIISIITDVVK